MPEQREDGGVIEGRCRGEPAEFPRIFCEQEIKAGKGDEARGDGKTGTTKNREKINRGEMALRLLCFWVRSSVTTRRSQGTRRRGTSSITQTFIDQTQGSLETQTHGLTIKTGHRGRETEN